MPRVFVRRDDFTIVGGKGDKALIRERVRTLREQLRKAHDMDDGPTIREMLHTFRPVLELRIGAFTEEGATCSRPSEQAMKTVMEGMESGIVPGGGAAYLACVPAILETPITMEDEKYGVHVIAKALEEPMRRIAINAGLSPSVAVEESRKSGPGYGLDVKTKQTVNMMEAGIVDPTLVVKRALQLASSGATMLLTTDTLILRRKPEESANP